MTSYFAICLLASGGYLVGCKGLDTFQVGNALGTEGGRISVWAVSGCFGGFGFGFGWVTY